MRSRSLRTGSCEICGIETRSLGFRVFVCKACAMFYRRTYHIQRELRCTAHGNCPLVGDHRSTCRFCRMKRCREVGLRMVNSNLVVQHQGFPVDDVVDMPIHPMFPSSAYLNAPRSSRPTKNNHSIKNERANPNPMPFCPHSNANSSYSPPANNSPPNYAQTAPSSSPGSSYGSSSNPTVMNFMDSSAGYSLERICPFIEVDAFEGFSLLRNAAQFYHRFERRQHALVNSLRNPNEVGLSCSMLVDNATYLRIESGSLSLVCLFVGDILKTATCELTTKHWMKALRTSLIQLSLLHKLCLAVRQFPNRGDTRMSCFFGAHVDFTDLRAHLGDNYDSRKTFIQPMWSVWYSSVERFRVVAPRSEESLILVLAFILEEVDRHYDLQSADSRYKHALYAEFYEFLAKIHGHRKAAVRLIQLLSLQLDVKTLTEAYEQMWELIRIFKPTHSEYIWHERFLTDDDNFLAEYQRIADEITNL